MSSALAADPGYFGPIFGADGVCRYRCQGCGKREPWSGGWGWHGSYKQWEDGLWGGRGGVQVWCSAPCETKVMEALKAAGTVRRKRGAGRVHT